jgi:uncharacterized Zn-binding protein involved in type VI secretion
MKGHYKHNLMKLSVSYVVFLLVSWLELASWRASIACPEKNIMPTQKQTIYFPKATFPIDAYPAAYAEGPLVLDGNCLRLGSKKEESVLLIWPYEARLRKSKNSIEVLNAEGKVVARVGDFIKTGGAGYPLDRISYIVGSSPDWFHACPGPYWLTNLGSK